MRARDAILDLFGFNKELTIREIVNRTDFSKQMAHYVIKKLLEEKKVERVGHPPKTIYRRLPPTLPGIQRQRLSNLSATDNAFLDDNFLVVTETGELLQGAPAFQHWCWQRSLPPDPTFLEYKLARYRYARHYDRNGYINGLEKLRKIKGFDKIWLNRLYYLDFGAIEGFDRTRLGALVYYAKHGQNKILMKTLNETIIDRVSFFLAHNHVDAVAFVPPAIRRELQLMKYLQINLDIYLPEVEIIKISGIMPVPQASLAKLDERIKKVENSYAVTDLRKFDHVVLIDDTVSSGATLNQIASKLKNKGIARSVTGLAIVGSPKGFDSIPDKQ